MCEDNMWHLELPISTENKINVNSRKKRHVQLENQMSQNHLDSQASQRIVGKEEMQRPLILNCD
jgi:hypothetical protein